MPTPERKRRWWLIAAALIALLLIALTGFVVWASTPLGPASEAEAALISDASVRVDLEPWLTFQPEGKTPTTGLILYPGGRVDYRSYAPLARGIAEQDHLVVVPSMPLSLAVFDPNVAGEIIAAHPEIDQWIIGGHSLGGAMAARYLERHPESAQGLMLLAAYPAASDDLSDTDLIVSSIIGSNDSVASQESMAQSRQLLPGDTNWVIIQGGNHAQFGDYGSQPGDSVADITASEQQQQTVAEAVALFQRLDESASSPDTSGGEQ